jgi:hypothetical protein
MMHGHGSFIWGKGDMFEGGWKAGKMHGQGTKKMANGVSHFSTSIIFNYLQLYPLIRDEASLWLVIV